MKQKWNQQINDFKVYSEPIKIYPNPDDINPLSTTTSPQKINYKLKNDNFYHHHIEKLDSQRVDLVISKVQKKLQLNKPTDVQKFNKNFESHKKLHTFVDYSKLIIKTNVLNNKEFLEDIKQYQIRKRLDQAVGEQLHTQTIDEKKDLLYKELYEEKQELQSDPDNLLEKFKLRLGPSLDKDKKLSPTIEINDYKTARIILQKASKPIRQRYGSLPILDEDYIVGGLVNCVTNQQQSNFEDNDFYQVIENNFENIEDRVFANQFRKQRLMEENQQKKSIKDGNLQKLAQRYGVDITSDYYNELGRDRQKDNQVYCQFQKRSEQLINKALFQSKKKHKIYLQVRVQQENEDQNSYRQNRQRDLAVSNQRLKKKQKSTLSEIKLDLQKSYEPFETEANSNFLSLTQIQSLPTLITFMESERKHASQASLLEKMEDSYKLDLVKLPQKKTIKYETFHTDTKMQSSQRSSKRNVLLSLQGQFKNLQASINNDVLKNQTEREILEDQFKKMRYNMDEMTDIVEFYRNKKIEGFNDEALYASERNLNEDITGQQKMFKRSRTRVMKIIKHE